jgi:hypothetical protein
MRFLIVPFVLILWLNAHTQSLQNTKHFSIDLPNDAADAPAIITITDSLYDYLHLADAGLERDIFFKRTKVICIY